ncbi:uncharacterized protein LOC126901128 isoform X2 [Daktulosphaira vitifoliae]|nr:uncharacterized protein LOC126901128 isoform X2 [Daktulosphaira vitifoliae]
MPEPIPEPKANPDEVAQFNRIINSIGWTSIIGMGLWDNPMDGVKIVQSVREFSYINDVNKTEFDETAKIVSMVLRKIYIDMLRYLCNNYCVMSLIYIFPDNLNKLINLKKIIKMMSMYKPLMTCMANALKYFECTNENLVLDVLNESLLLSNKLTTNNNFHNLDNTLNYKFINSTLEKIHYFSLKHKSFKVEKIFEILVEPFLENYIAELEILEKSSLRDNSIDPQFNNKIDEGVILLCRNFGF